MKDSIMDLKMWKKFHEQYRLKECNEWHDNEKHVVTTC